MSAVNSLTSPILIAGPCAAESRQQVLSIANQLKDSGISYFRSGVWKPRSRPGTFEGIGVKALEWLQEVHQTYHIKPIVEVANTQHAEEIIKAKIPAVWIGARTTVNPFLVSEIAEALRGTSIKVMVKNPVNPDLELWIGAIERLMKVGIHVEAAIHRGFSQYGVHQYRNEPAWEIPLELMRRLPGLAVLCDPSHIGGSRSLLHDLSQKAADLGYNGLMIETHNNPSEALSDQAQQLTPQAFISLIQAIVWRKAEITDPVSRHSLEQLRTLIDGIDHRIILLIADRMELAKKIGFVKKEQDIQIYQPERWNAILQHVKQCSQENQLSEDLMTKLFEFIHQESIRKQSMVMYGKVIEPSES